jgi:ribosomal protein S18 acetylase RimI-like enzyme
MSNPTLHFRPARAGDADACAPLIFASGVSECRFYFGASDEQCIAFLRYAFTSDHSRYSWRRHYVSCAADGTVLSVIAAHHHPDVRLDDLHVVWLGLRFFGLGKTIPMLPRGMIIEREMLPPKRGQILLGNFATEQRVRGTGIFTAMLTDALTSGWLRWTSDNQYLLDVRLDNTRARHLYERLGFAAQPRQRPPHPRLPTELTAMRMIWSAQGMAALRAQTTSTRKLSDNAAQANSEGPW